MDQDQLARKKSLEQQLEWSKEQARILDEMDVKLHEMKKIAEYALEHKLSEDEIQRLNGELNVLKSELSSLEKQLYPIALVDTPDELGSRSILN